MEEYTGPAPARPARSGRKETARKETKLPEKAGSEYRAPADYYSPPREVQRPTGSEPVKGHKGTKDLEPSAWYGRKILPAAGGGLEGRGNPPRQ